MKEPDCSNSYNKRLVQHDAVHHDYARCIARWMRPDPFHISASDNPLLRCGQEPMVVEAGDYYEHKVFGKAFPDPAPFPLQLHVLWKERYR
mmetsp:Transcript_71897/g.191939  ORF Transcript_71897/g.191939 Transcript_71897/m.191939 type:complete len:91 (-) Transcript_71897:2-274(-)